LLRKVLTSAAAKTSPGANVFLGIGFLCCLVLVYYS
jgi:hypothetical protein